MKRRVTQEWSRASGRSTVLRGTRRASPWRRIGLLVGMLFVAFLVGRFLGRDTTNTDVVTEPSVLLDVGGGSAASAGDGARFLGGSTLTVPVQDAIVLEQTDDQEAEIAQDTAEVSIQQDAQQAVLRPVAGTYGSGSASSEFSAASFQHVVAVTLPNPPEGYFYEGWLIRSKPFDFFSTGRLIQHADDLEWYVLYKGAEDKLDYKKVVVTLEKDDANPAPADHVLEGILE